MRFSAKERYAIRAMIDVAVSGAGKPMSAAAVAERQGLSLDYLEQIFSRLRRAGLLTSVRGARGGFLLARAAKAISIWDIICAIGEPLSPAPCSSASGVETHCHRAATCRARILWRKIADGMRGILEQTTLSDFLEAGEFTDGPSL